MLCEVIVMETAINTVGPWNLQLLYLVSTRFWLELGSKIEQNSPCIDFFLPLFCQQHGIASVYIAFILCSERTLTREGEEERRGGREGERGENKKREGTGENIPFVGLVHKCQQLWLRPKPGA